MDRLLAGQPACSNGSLTVVALAAEAGGLSSEQPRSPVSKVP